MVPVSAEITAAAHRERLSETGPGAFAYIDRPYGTFSVDREAGAAGVVMIAGRVGITHVIAKLHALQERRDRRPVILIYANPDWESVAFRDELEEMALMLDLTVIHVIENPPDPGWLPPGHRAETGRIDAALLDHDLPEATRSWPHMLCGPVPLVSAVRRGLRDLGVARARDRQRNIRAGVTMRPLLARMFVAPLVLLAVSFATGFAMILQARADPAPAAKQPPAPVVSAR